MFRAIKKAPLERCQFRSLRLLVITKEIYHTMQTYTTQKQSISPTIIVIPHTSTKDIVSLHFENGVNINALHVNNFTHRCERQSQLKLRGVIDIHLVTTGSPNVYYLVVQSPENKEYRCSCYGFRRNGQCEHCEAVKQQEAVVA